MPDKARFESLQARRQACAHPCAIDIVNGDARTSYRFCLLCGERERKRTSERDMPAYRIFTATKIVRTESCATAEIFDQAMELYGERLFKRGLFSEFDAAGRWLGDNDPHIIRGED